MTRLLTSAWVTVLLGVIGLTVGYAMYLHNHTDIARAAYQCPLQKNCTAENCDINCEHCKNAHTS